MQRGRPDICRLPHLVLSPRTSEFLFFPLQPIYANIHYTHLKVLCDKDSLTVCGEMYGKTQTQTKSGQQEKARPLENSP